MSTAIFIRTYAKDLPYLEYCLRSLHKFAHGFSEILIAVPETEKNLYGHLTAERLIPVYDGQPGYLCQMADKMNADKHSHADYFWYFDTDCVLTEPVTPQDFMVSDKARWLITPWKDCMDVKKHWFHVMCRCLMECPEHEFMRRHGIIIPRWALAAFREHILQIHGTTMDAYVMNVPRHEFSEFNCIGFYLWLYHRDKIAWHDTSTMGVPPCPIEQAWSWDEKGITQEYRNRMEILLA